MYAIRRPNSTAHYMLRLHKSYLTESCCMGSWLQGFDTHSPTAYRSDHIQYQFDFTISNQVAPVRKQVSPEVASGKYRAEN